MREPPDTTTVKDPLSLANLSDKSAVYFARDTASSSSVSNTSTTFLFFWSTVVIPEEAMDDAFAVVVVAAAAVPLDIFKAELIEQLSFLKFNDT
jgi:hypothetical protein